MEAGIRKRERPRKAVSSTDIDRYVGARVRECRLGLGMTMEQVADRVGITCQQLHRYESGANRLTAGRFLTIAAALLVEPALLLPAKGRQRPALSPGQQRQLLTLARNFAAIADPRRQQAICDLARVLAGRGPGVGSRPDREGSAPWLSRVDDLLLSVMINDRLRQRKPARA